MMPSECVRDIEDICWSKGCAFLRLHIHLGEPFEMVFSLRIKHGEQKYSWSSTARWVSNSKFGIPMLDYEDES
jgi:hypothetical protein